MHYKDDRVDRDTLEPAARKVDELMNMFAGNSTDPALVIRMSAEIQSTLDKVSNPKSTEALREAGAELTAILGVIEAGDDQARLAAHYRSI